MPALLPPETTTEELGSFVQNRWKVFLLKWSIGDESRIQNKTWNRFSQREAIAFKSFWPQWICILDIAISFVVCCLDFFRPRTFETKKLILFVSRLMEEINPNKWRQMIAKWVHVPWAFTLTLKGWLILRWVTEISYYSLDQGLNWVVILFLVPTWQGALCHFPAHKMKFITFWSCGLKRKENTGPYLVRPS